MNTQHFEDWLKMNRAALAPAAQWHALAAEAAQKAVQYNLNVAQNCLDIGARQIELLGSLKEPQTFSVEATKLASDIGQKAVERATDAIKIVRETQEAVVHWTENSVKATVDAAKPQA